MTKDRLSDLKTVIILEDGINVSNYIVIKIAIQAF